MPRSSSALIQSLKSPATLVHIGDALEAALSIWGLRRRPKTPGAVFRRVLVTGAVAEATHVFAQQYAAGSLQGVPLLEPAESYRGPVGDVPVRIAPTWDRDPQVHTINGRLVMVAGPTYEQLPVAEQEKAYGQALALHTDPTVMMAAVAVSAVLRYGLYRVIIGSRPKPTRKRSLTMVLAVMAVDAGLQIVGRQISVQRRHARVARERS